ncbi:MAG: DUF429 domain-containing protein [Limnohabitans sp.]|jgi:hypothetical protein|nr:DUF429 domain-containing protein [Limnohabitans sp.]
MKSAPTRATVDRSRVVIHGVDFSGGEGGGAAKIRIAERALATRSAVAVRGRIDRNGLRRAILESRNDGRAHLWRIDAPFGLPLECFAGERPASMPKGALTWLDIATWMSEFQTARDWRGAMREMSRREPRRACDRALRTPLAPMNLRVFKQTFTVITEILLPLAREGVEIMPVTVETDGDAGHASVRVCESCPASVLQHRGWPAKGYKGKGEPPRVVREEIVRLLRKDGLEIASDTAVEAIHDVEGDLLDALLLTTAPIQEQVPAEFADVARVEAWVY